MHKGRLAFFALLVFGSSLFAIRGFTWDMGIPKFYFSSVSIAVFVVFSSLKAVRKPYRLGVSVPQIFALLFGAYACLTTLQLLGALPQVFLTSLGFAMNLLLFVLFSVLLSAERSDVLLTILQLFMFAGLVIAFDAVFSFYSGHGLLWGTDNNPFSRGNLSSVIGNVNFTTDLMAMLLFPAAFLTVSNRKIWKFDKIRRAFYLALFSLFLIVIMIGQTRAVYYSVIGSIIFIAAFSIFPLLRFKLRSFASALDKLFIVLLIVSAAGIMIIYSGDNVLTSGRFSFSERISYTTEDSISVDVRILQWKAAVKQWEKSAVLGTGFGSYKYLSTENMGEVIVEQPKYMYVAGLNSIRTHNEYLQQMGETGVVGVLLIAGFVISMLLNTIKVVRKSSSVDRIIQYLFLTAGLLVIFVHSILSFPGHLMPNALFAAFLFGFIMSPDLSGERRAGFHVSKALPLLMVVFALTTSVLMSRTFVAEGLFTRGYIEYRRLESINPQIPELVNSIGNIRKEVEAAESLEGKYSYLQSEIYVSERFDALAERYPNAPVELLQSMASEEREKAFESTLTGLNSKLRAASSALLNARQDSTESFYSAMRNLSTSREISGGQYLSEAYLGYMYLTAQRKEDFRLKLNMAGRDIGNAFREIFSRADIFSDWLSEDTSPGAMLRELQIDHAYLSGLADLLKPDLEATAVSELLENIDVNLLIDYQVTLDAIDALLRSLKISPDLQVVRNAANLLFRVIASSEMIANELENFDPYVISSNDLNSLVETIKRIPESEREDLTTLYDIAIDYNPGGWLKGNDNIYGEYSRNLLLLYGLEALDKVLEIAEKEVFAWSVMKATDRVVPSGSIGELTPLKEHVSKTWFDDLYGEVHSWCKDTSIEISMEIEEGELSEEALSKAKTALDNSEKFLQLHLLW
ncbi:MAG TPA: O-antigen ligase family protein [Mesotoga infera]|uniref:O-antigen ligase family protein n=1 Tax=Mesotoga infera TaxID=1236046 RepID=A0A7C1CUN7_9BACT|nr:O-antigen ligase family protein [Mesotoga infera]